MKEETVEVEIELGLETLRILENEANKQEISVNDLINKILLQFLNGEIFSIIEIEVEAKLKLEAECVFEKLNITAEQVIVRLYEYVARERKLPFDMAE